MRRNKPERRAEALLDAALRDDALLPFLARHGDAARRHDLAGFVFARRSDGDELLGREARIEQLGESVRDGRRQRHRRERSRIAVRLGLAARGSAAGRWRGQWPVAATGSRGVCVNAERMAVRASASLKPSSVARAMSCVSASSAAMPASRNWHAASNNSALRCPSAAPCAR